MLHDALQGPTIRGDWSNEFPNFPQRELIHFS